MSHSLRLSHLLENEADKLENITAAVFNQEDSLVWASAMLEYGDEKEALDMDSQEEIDDLDLSEKAEIVRSSREYAENMGSFEPMSGYGYVCDDIRKQDVIKILEHASDITLMKYIPLNMSFITLSGVGTDASDAIAYAYLTIEKHIPQCFGNITSFNTVSEEAKREIQEYQGTYEPSDMGM